MREIPQCWITGQAAGTAPPPAGWPGLAAGAAAPATPLVRAQAFPNKPLRMIFGFVPLCCPKRSPQLPEVPTAAELGLGKLTITPWAGYFGSAGLPAELVDKLSAELRSALARPNVHDPLVGQGFSSYGMSAADFSAFFKRQYDGFVATVRDNNVRFE